MTSHEPTSGAPSGAYSAWAPSLRLGAAFALGILIGVLCIVKVVPAPKLTASSGPQVQSGGPQTTSPIGHGTAKPGTKGKTVVIAGTSASKGANAKSAAACNSTDNGGKTDRGVTANRISMATTVVASGIGSAFQGGMESGMEAVVRQVNSAGGICGRMLHIDYQDDGWVASTGAQYLRTYINGGLFAIPVGASSEGLKVVIDSGDITSSETPVVGTDGLEIDQYMTQSGSAQPWVWPVATATVSSARIMVDEAYKRGARNFAVVYDKDYHFGREAATAFNAEVKRLTHADVKGYPSSSCTSRYCGISAGANSYGSEALTVKQSGPDFIALFLEPQTAQTWMADPNTPPAGGNAAPTYGYGGAQPLFTYQFENQCGAKCDQMIVWTGFKPVVEQYQSDPAVQEFVSSLRTVDPGADKYNQFTEGAYLGMKLLVEALRAVGPNLTRAALKQELDAINFASGITLQPALKYTTDTRFANLTMQGFVMQYKGSAGGWRAGPIGVDQHPEAGAG
jgi:ABC-type branched-subunit amino acid transport system substrate-binding protein